MRYVINRADGGISIGETDDIDHTFSQWRQSAEEGWLPATILEHKKPFPDDRTFRDAWINQGSKIGVDIKKAKDIARENIRLVRNAKLSQLDIEVNKELEGGGVDILSIAGKKQRARDATTDARLISSANETELKTAMEQIVNELGRL